MRASFVLAPLGAPGPKHSGLEFRDKALGCTFKGLVFKVLGTKYHSEQSIWTPTI